jgi:hypothetical protein
MKKYAQMHKYTTIALCNPTAAKPNTLALLYGNPPKNTTFLYTPQQHPTTVPVTPVKVYYSVLFSAWRYPSPLPTRRRCGT